MHPIVDIVVGGVQKAATTSLYASLAEHPALCPATRKETHFFDDETIDWRAPDYRRFHDFFPGRDGARRCFDVTPIYLFWPQSLARIAAYNPDVRLIFIFRDPIERAWSNWCMEYARGAESMPFSEAIRDGRRRLDGLAPTHAARRTYTYVERGFYGVQVERLLGLFPRDQILFLKSDDLSRAPTATLRSVSEFLGLAPFEGAEPKREHRRAAIDYPSSLIDADISYLRGLYRSDAALFANLSGLDVRDWLVFE